MEIEGTKFKIEERIFTIRGKQVMLDRDLAQLYGVETKQLNRAVKRNIERFPPDFMFQIEKAECLRCQIGTLNIAQANWIVICKFCIILYHDINLSAYIILTLLFL